MATGGEFGWPPGPIASVTNIGDGKATIGYDYTINRSDNLARWQAAGISLTASQVVDLQAIDTT